MLGLLHLVASGVFIFFRGGVAVAASPVAVAEPVTGAAVAEAPAVVLAAAAPVKGTAVAGAASVALAASAPLKGAAVTETAAFVLAAAASAVGLVAAAALAAAVADAAEAGPDPDACIFCLFSQASLLSLLYCFLLVRWALLCLLWENCCFTAAQGEGHGEIWDRRRRRRLRRS